MENTFIKGICQIGVFMICAQTFVHFCPKGTYEKYLKMLVSIMMLIQILSPLGAIFGEKGLEMENATTGEWLEEVLMKGMDEVLQENDPESKDTESVWQNDVQAGEAASDSMEQIEKIYIEPVAPIRVGQ